MSSIFLAGLIGLLVLVPSCGSSGGPDSPDPFPEPSAWVWQRIADFGGQPIRGAQVFTINNAAYVVSGMGDDCLPHRQVWKYDPSTNAWTRKADYPGTPVIEGVGFSIGSTGYVCSGNANTPAGLMAEFWQYDPAADHWTQKSNFPGGSRSGSAAVTIGQKAYVFAGFSTVHEKDLWEYDQAADAWTRKADCPGQGRFLCAGFAVGTKAYFGTGAVSGTGLTFCRDFWEYDPLIDSWTRKADFPGTERDGGVGLAAGGKGYLGLGLQGVSPSLAVLRDVWEYDPGTDVWTRRTDFGGAARSMAVGFVLGSNIYYGTGNNSNNQNLRDLWRTRPATVGQSD